MSAAFSSSNPFRRKASPSSTTISPPANPTIPSFFQEETSATPKNEYTYIERQDVPKKVPKKVRVQSPPPRSPSVADSASTIGEESIPFKHPLALPSDEDEDPFGSVTSDLSEDEETRKPARAPILNPFSKTLETMEHPERDALGITTTITTNPVRASMDVDAFKRLLLTGNAGISTAPTPPQAPPVHPIHRISGDGGSSSTETSSLSRQSIFEPVQEPLPESPRTSHDISEPDEERRVLSESPIQGRKKPPPPSSRHGKLIKMELRGEPTSTPPTSPPQAVPIPTQYFPSITTTPNRSLTDLNKPLPPAPTRASGELERESIFDSASAGRAPEPPSPSSSIRRKTPPAPPITRRHSQLVSDPKLSRSNSSRLSPKVEEDNASIYSIESGRPRSNSGKAPPPPPIRKHALVRASSHHVSTTSSTPLPAPPPARGSSRHNRASSIHSIESSNPSAANKRSSVVAPPPPPRHRQTRNSTDLTPIASSNPKRLSGENTSLPSLEQYRRSSNASSLSHTSRLEENTPPNSNPQNGDSGSGNKNILADLSALQQEIDALRNQSQQRQRSVT
ncbi:kinesin family member 22 protein [Rutstroemia sp. NJR-2017a BVV2]|nr:kinesin family member 22 protein [Rutstroemia sp. NJR-2017a BVV2]